MPAKRQRRIEYELLRIVAMLMIVCLHYLGKGGLLGDPARPDMTAAGYAAWLIEAFCIVAVDVYVLITGYFGVDISPQDGERATFWSVLRRPARIWRQVTFYSLTIGCGALILGGQGSDIYRIFSYCFPIVTEHYWFASSYIFLCLMMPFLNAGFSRLGKKEVQSLMAGALLLLCIAKTVLPMHLPRDHGGYDDVWFIVLYLTGAYLRRYGSAALRSRARSAALYLGSVAAIFASFCLLRTIFLRTGRLGEMISYAYAYNHLFCFTGAVGLFSAFAAKGETPLLERARRPIELVAGASFGVYLIHEHIDIRNAWPMWAGCAAQSGSPVGAFLLHMAGTVLAVYAACTMIEIVRRWAARLVFDRFLHTGTGKS